LDKLIAAHAKVKPGGTIERLSGFLFGELPNSAILFVMIDVFRCHAESSTLDACEYLFESMVA
jgi:hypothetical protein